MLQAQLIKDTKQIQDIKNFRNQLESYHKGYKSNKKTIKDLYKHFQSFSENLKQSIKQFSSNNKQQNQITSGFIEGLAQLIRIIDENAITFKEGHRILKNNGQAIVGMFTSSEKQMQHIQQTIKNINTELNKTTDDVNQKKKQLNKKLQEFNKQANLQNNKDVFGNFELEKLKQNYNAALEGLSVLQDNAEQSEYTLISKSQQEVRKWTESLQKIIQTEIDNQLKNYMNIFYFMTNKSNSFGVQSSNVISPQHTNISPNQSNIRDKSISPIQQKQRNMIPISPFDSNKKQSIINNPFSPIKQKQSNIKPSNNFNAQPNQSNNQNIHKQNISWIFNQNNNQQRPNLNQQQINLQQSPGYYNTPVQQRNPQRSLKKSKSSNNILQNNQNKINQTCIVKKQPFIQAQQNLNPHNKIVKQVAQNPLARYFNERQRFIDNTENIQPQYNRMQKSEFLESDSETVYSMRRNQRFQKGGHEEYI